MYPMKYNTVQQRSETWTGLLLSLTPYSLLMFAWLLMSSGALAVRRSMDLVMSLMLRVLAPGEALASFSALLLPLLGDSDITFVSDTC